MPEIHLDGNRYRRGKKLPVGRDKNGVIEMKAHRRITALAVVRGIGAGIHMKTWRSLNGRAQRSLKLGVYRMALEH